MAASVSRPHSRSQSGGEMEELSSREEEVLALLAEGLSNREIALALGLSPRTIETYLHRLYKKLGVHKRRCCGTPPAAP